MHGLAWPQVLRPELREQIAEALNIILPNGTPNWAALGRHRLIAEMIASGQYADAHAAYAGLQAFMDSTRGGYLAYFEKPKVPVPAEWLEWDLRKIVTPDWFVRGWERVEFAREFGDNNLRAEMYLNEILRQFGEAKHQMVREWYKRLTRQTPPKEVDDVFLGQALWVAGQIQTAKLTPLTSEQNWWQRWLTGMYYNTRVTVPAFFEAMTKSGKRRAIETGAVPFHPYESTMEHNFKSTRGRTFAGLYCRLIGMSQTEWGNNATAAMVASRGIGRDLELLANHAKNPRVAAFARAWRALGGTNKAAILRRTHRLGLTRRAVMR